MDVARLNFSHGSADEHAETARLVRDAAGRAGRQVAILQDLPGPKLRIGKLREGRVEFKPGDETTFICGPDVGEGDAKRLFITYAGLASTVDRDEIMYLADGSVRLRVTAVRSDDGEIDAVVEVGGSVASRQGLNIPGETAALPSVPEEDLEHVRTGERIGVDIVALSFVRRAEDVTQLRKHTRLPLVAKIEKPQAVQRLEEIVRATDCVMVARGDLGIEMDIQDVPIVQKQIIALSGALARPVITATQMLDSMVASSRPTRAEVTDVANAILDGTDAVMLSQESAVGQYPVESVAMLASVARRTEQTLPYREWNERRVRRDRRDPAYTLAYTATKAAQELNLAALVCPTLSGRSRPFDLRAPPERADLRALAGARDRPPLRADVGRAGRLDAPLRGHRGTDRGRRQARRGARLVQARRPRRHHRRPPVRQAGHDVAAPDPRGLVRFRPRDLARIASGEVTLAFRRWEKPRVRVGSRMKTPIGVLEVDSVSVVESISLEDARAAGFESVEAAMSIMRNRVGPIHRVALHLAGPDPRIELRETPPDSDLFARLDRMGPWTWAYLEAIRDQPEVRAADLAEQFGVEMLVFKRDVRRLKELGLTISHRPGYRLSPRGEQAVTASRPSTRASSRGGAPRPPLGAARRDLTPGRRPALGWSGLGSAKSALTGHSRSARRTRARVRERVMT